MNFYNLNTVIQQSHLNIYLKYVIIFIALFLLIVAFTLYLRHRLQTKYRDLSIMMLLVLLFMVGVQYSDYQQNQSRFAQSSQMVTFIKSVAKEFNVSKNSVEVSSVQLSDGVIVKIKQQYYTVTLSTDQNSYQLTKTHLINGEKN